MSTNSIPRKWKYRKCAYSCYVDSFYSFNSRSTRRSKGRKRNHEKETNNETAESTPVIVGLQERIEEPGGIPTLPGIPTLTGMETEKKPESTGSEGDGSQIPGSPTDKEKPSQGPKPKKKNPQSQANVNKKPESETTKKNSADQTTEPGTTDAKSYTENWKSLRQIDHSRYLTTQFSFEFRIQSQR